MAKKKLSKAEKQKFINKIIADGKISGKDMQRAANKGISLDRIQKAHDKSFSSGNPFSYDKDVPDWRKEAAAAYTRSDTRSAGRQAGSLRPSDDRMFADVPSQPAYSPLIIKKDALNVVPKKAVTAEPTPVAAPVAEPTDAGNPYLDQINDLMGDIDEMMNQDMELPTLPTPTTVWNTSTGVSDKELKLSPASKTKKRTGVSAFRRRQAKGGAKKGLRTIKSMNV